MLCYWISLSKQLAHSIKICTLQRNIFWVIEWLSIWDWLKAIRMHICHLENWLGISYTIVYYHYNMYYIQVYLSFIQNLMQVSDHVHYHRKLIAPLFRQYVGCVYFCSVGSCLYSRTVAKSVAKHAKLNKATRFLRQIPWSVCRMVFLCVCVFCFIVFLQRIADPSEYRLRLQPKSL